LAIAFLPLVARLGPAAAVGFGTDHPGDPAVSRTEFDRPGPAPGSTSGRFAPTAAVCGDRRHRAEAVSSGRVFRRLWAQAGGCRRLRAPLTYDSCPRGTPGGRDCAGRRPGRGASVFRKPHPRADQRHGLGHSRWRRPASRRWWSRAALRCRRLIGCAEPVANDDLVLAAFAEVRKPPPDELLGVSSEVVLIERSRSAWLCSGRLPNRRCASGRR